MACQFLQQWRFGWVPAVPLKRLISWKESLNTLSSEDSVTRSPNPGSIDPKAEVTNFRLPASQGLLTNTGLSPFLLSSSQQNCTSDVLLYSSQRGNYARGILLMLFLMLYAQLEEVTSIGQWCIRWLCGEYKVNLPFPILNYKTTRKCLLLCLPYDYLFNVKQLCVLIWYLYCTIGLAWTADRNLFGISPAVCKARALEVLSLQEEC